MLMDFQIEGGQAVAVEIASEIRELPLYRAPSHEVRTFELPASVWIAMFACYAIFFAALFVATGHGTAAIFALLVSIAYTVMYFGTAAILNGVGAAERQVLPPAGPFDGFATQAGWMDNRAALAQILTVPVLLAVFACSFALIRVFV